MLDEVKDFIKNSTEAQALKAAHEEPAWESKSLKRKLPPIAKKAQELLKRQKPKPKKEKKKVCEALFDYNLKSFNNSHEIWFPLQGKKKNDTAAEDDEAKTEDGEEKTETEEGAEKTESTGETEKEEVKSEGEGEGKSAEEEKSTEEVKEEEEKVQEEIKEETDAEL